MIETNTIHYINFSTWWLKYEEHPAGSICAKIFRNQDITKGVEYFINGILLSNEVGMPKNILNAFLFYVDIYLSTEQKEEILAKVGDITPITLKEKLELQVV